MLHEPLPRSKAELESEWARESLAAPAALRRLASRVASLSIRAALVRRPLVMIRRKEAV